MIGVSFRRKPESSWCKLSIEDCSDVASGTLRRQMSGSPPPSRASSTPDESVFPANAGIQKVAEMFPPTESTIPRENPNKEWKRMWKPELTEKGNSTWQDFCDQIALLDSGFHRNHPWWLSPP